MSTIITVANAKGGVGKTTVATNLSAALATNREEGCKVCTVDFDFQSNLTQALTQKDVEIGPCLYDILSNVNPAIEDCIYPTVHPRLDIIPSVIELSGLEIGLYADFPESNLMFRNFARDYLIKKYDYIICDVGPNLNIFFNQALCVSDAVFIIAEVGSANSMANVFAVINHITGMQHENANLKYTKIIMNKLNLGRKIDKKNIAAIKEKFTEKDYYDTVIPVSVDFRTVEEEQHSTIYTYKSQSKGATAFRNLAKEVINDFPSRRKDKSI